MEFVIKSKPEEITCLLRSGVNRTNPRESLSIKKTIDNPSVLSFYTGYSLFCSSMVCVMERSK